MSDLPVMGRHRGSVATMMPEKIWSEYATNIVGTLCWCLPVTMRQEEAPKETPCRRC